MFNVRTAKLGEAAYALAHGGKLVALESGVIVVSSPWPLEVLTEKYSASAERRFDRHIIHLRDASRKKQVR